MNEITFDDPFFDERIEELTIGGYDGINISNAGDNRSLDNVLGRNIHLKTLELHFSHDEWPVESQEPFWTGLSHNRSIEALTIYSHHLDGFEPILLTAFFESNRSLRELCFLDSPSGHEEWETFLLALSSCKFLEKLTLYHVTNDNSAMLSRLGLVLGSMDVLESLFLAGDNFDKSLAETLVWLLQTPQVKLKSLKLTFSNYSDEAIITLAKWLEINESVKFLHFDRGTVSSNGLEALANTLRLCNDKIQDISFGACPKSSQKEIKQLVAMNSHNIEGSARKRKSLDFDFLDPERAFNDKPLGEGFDVRLLPHVISSIGSSRGDCDHRSEIFWLNALLRFVKNKPDLKHGGKAKQTIATTMNRKTGSATNNDIRGAGVASNVTEFDNAGVEALVELASAGDHGHGAGNVAGRNSGGRGGLEGGNEINNKIIHQRSQLIAVNQAAIDALQNTNNLLLRNEAISETGAVEAMKRAIQFMELEFLNRAN